MSNLLFFNVYVFKNNKQNAHYRNRRNVLFDKKNYFLHRKIAN